MGVVVDRDKQTIKYIIKGHLQAVQRNQMLGDKSRLFMPYLEMSNPEDAV